MTILLGTLSSLGDTGKRARPTVVLLSHFSEEARDHSLWQKVVSRKIQCQYADWLLPRAENHDAKTRHDANDASERVRAIGRLMTGEPANVVANAFGL